MEATELDPWRAQANAVRDLLTSHAPSVIGIYVHGSAALGGFGPASDLDILVVADASACEVDWAGAGRELVQGAAAGRNLELSVVERAAAATPAAPWPFLLHVNSGDQRSVLGGAGGDPDLIAHYAVVRAAGVPIVGPPPAEVVGAVTRGVLLDYLIGELDWGRNEADQRYAVLNACRAVGYAESGLLLSKVAGSQRWLEQFGPEPLVTSCLQAQRAGTNLGPCSPAARVFVDEAIKRLRSGGGNPL